MNAKALWKPFVLYTCLFGLLTVGAISFATDSGFVVLLTAGGGLTLAVLSVGAAGPTGVSDAEHASDAEVAVEDAGMWATTTSTSSSLIFLFYGLGVLLWSLVLLYTVYDIAG